MMPMRASFARTELQQVRPVLRVIPGFKDGDGDGGGGDPPFAGEGLDWRFGAAFVPIIVVGVGGECLVFALTEGWVDRVIGCLILALAVFCCTIVAVQAVERIARHRAATTASIRVPPPLRIVR